MKSPLLKICTLILVMGAPLPIVHAQTDNVKKDSKPRTIARLFWQDMDSQTLKWGDLCRINDQWQLSPQTLEHFPKIALETQNLVQMESINDHLIVGIHDNDRGNVGSGWVSIASGVEIEEHGDHVHAQFEKPPQVVQSMVDTDQGNPAHIYRYGDKIFIANDAKNGFTIVEFNSVQNPSAPFGSKFYSGGGNHITLAAVSDHWCYCTWADREGENKGRVDIIPIGSNNHSQSRTTYLPVGGLHGATTNSGKVFLAPSDGIFILDASSPTSTKTTQDADLSIPITLGTDPVTNKPNRTGAFANQGDYVLFSFGTGEHSQIGLIDAASHKPSLLALPLGAGSNQSPSTPRCTVGANSKQYAWVVLQGKDDPTSDILRAVELDPNGDKKTDDVKIHGSLDLGRSKIQGHSGHHEIAFLPNRRLACISNPGDGSLWLVSLHGLEVLAKFEVGGAPTRIVAFGE